MQLEFASKVIERINKNFDNSRENTYTKKNITKIEKEAEQELSKRNPKSHR